jgi:hypothetical protein
MRSKFASRLVKKSVLLALRRMLESTAVQDLREATMRQPRRGHAHLASTDLHTMIPPYAGLMKHGLHSRISRRDEAIFITARFRSGSTLLWNVFRHVEGMTAYYEPFNERRWFGPSTRGDRIDTTHRHVDDYWREYDGLEELGQFYRLAWISKDLLMDAEMWDPAMKQYVDLLLDKAGARPVLQFNRIDFRLPWFRHHFPQAMIVHLYRHPREQWCSTLMDVTCYPRTASMARFAPHDKFYLRRWAHDLKYHFPFLDEARLTHAYQMFYLVWKLSYLFGVKYSDYSLAYESLLDEPDKQIAQLFTRLHIEDYDLGALRALIAEPSREKWKTYADEDWFRSQESWCESILADFFGQHISCC